ncbi:cob(I)yrinic acid a,c-diamide adenosyltransferase [Geobacter sp. SVR]|uniref:cob(I)yrinic acid a,c-diamide adenosyltransferase n=1 Tax=Geobacter sp. SVR TaxID=2495594 RepID=UPI00143EF759|nr:cob(I)yrinic acid a,c-diamide adenosyltransferase [Geobacter sp. SVR]BCS55854.1 cob(I)alamin adenolsyltransferase/cobinamide ATP-dependent adenolsyltransferase [Geobacter sp. SVR]GCF83858.1 cob(I)alamin adenolsyltransferase/cobinamide ATP-dependent adenolsyltransferase [Geobacter sp. SVR]
MSLERGCIQVYTGNGKGKTTASLGLAVRAVGRGLRACVFQFIKGGGPYGEHLIAEKLGPLFTIIQSGRPGWVNKSDISEDRRIAQEALERVTRLLVSGDYDLVIMDEILGAIGFGLIDTEQVLELMRQKPPTVELVLTGRNAPEEIIAAADLVTEMREIKHYYKAGVPARTGIEM